MPLLPPPHTFFLLQLFIPSSFFFLFPPLYLFPSHLFLPFPLTPRRQTGAIPVLLVSSLSPGPQRHPCNHVGVSARGQFSTQLQSSRRLVSSFYPLIILPDTHPSLVNRIQDLQTDLVACLTHLVNGIVNDVNGQLCCLSQTCCHSRKRCLGSCVLDIRKESHTGEFGAAPSG